MYYAIRNTSIGSPNVWTWVFRLMSVWSWSWGWYCVSYCSLLWYSICIISWCSVVAPRQMFNIWLVYALVPFIRFCVVWCWGIGTARVRIGFILGRILRIGCGFRCSVLVTSLSILLFRWSSLTMLSTRRIAWRSSSLWLELWLLSIIYYTTCIQHMHTLYNICIHYYIGILVNTTDTTYTY